MAYLAQARFEELINPVVTMLGFELVGIEYFPRGKKSLLRIYIDKPDGISLDDCAVVSHQVSGTLDVEDPIKGNYILEVSSPGIDRPLFKMEHFAQFAGNKVKLRLVYPRDGQRNLKGTLQGMENDNVKLEVDGKLLLLPFSTIEKAKLVPDL